VLAAIATTKVKLTENVRRRKRVNRRRKKE